MFIAEYINAIATSLFLAISLSTAAQEYPEMLKVEAGTFKMGNSNGAIYEKPVHKVKLSSFSISKYPITVAQYRSFCNATGKAMPDAPSWGWQDKHPMVNVSWHDASAYCNWLSEKLDGTYSLPTEAQWEYAAQGGNRSRGYQYSGGNDLDSVGWFGGNANEQTQAVGQKKPNELGIYDMSGNVKEWCADWYSDKYYAKSPRRNPTGPASGVDRILRGGSWLIGIPEYCTITLRDLDAPDNSLSYIGFRVVRIP